MQETKADKHARVSVEHERLVSLIGSMADGVIAVDDRLRVVLYNGAALELLDINSDLKNRPISSILCLYDGNGQVIDVSKIIRKSATATSSRDLRMKYKDGSMSNIYLSIAPVRLGYGENGDSGHVLLLRDITREKSLEEERDEFIGVVSHELRTPIAIAEGNISNAKFLVERGDDLTKITEALKVAHDQIIFLAGLVNDLSTLSRAERGKLTLDLVDINVADFLDTLVGTYRDSAHKKGLNLAIQTADNLGTLHSSELYIKEILQNFITNAIKYSESGTVNVSAAPTECGVEFRVVDTGIGISKADRERVFDKFFRSENFQTRAHSGTGLGLYVCMKLASLIHAEIDLTSELGRGSTFIIAVPDLR